jgi:hypothetical protein
VLSGLANLNWLNIGVNQISDISALSGLTNLTNLYMGNNPLGTGAICTDIPTIISNNPGIEIEYSTGGLNDTDGDGEWDVCEADMDGDAIANEVDTYPLVSSNAFSDTGLGGTTSGTITNRGDQALEVTEAANPDGVRIISSAGTTPATITACGGASEISISAGDDVIVTCSSVIVKVISGAVDIVFVADDGTTSTVSLSAGMSLTFETDVNTVTAPASNPAPVVVLVDDEEFTIEPGETVTLADTDGDGVSDRDDNCVSTPNPAQVDTDGDGIGDVCDACALDEANDADGDGVCGDVDICPGFDDNADADADTVPDACDACPLDANNDADSDGICGDIDSCPLDPDNDTDIDGVCGDIDNCPATPNPGQADTDGDHIGDVCDDNDGDGYYYVNDCNDNDASINPDATEICDEVDNNCDGSVDEGVTTTFYGDSDSAVLKT